MLNRVTVMGRLGRDPELRTTQSGISVTSFSVAVDRDYKSDSGERDTDWIDVIAWRQTAEFACKYLAKGKLVVVDGRLQSRSWTDRDGKKRTTLEVVADSCYFAESAKTGSGDTGHRQRAPYPAARSYAAPPPAASSFTDITDDYEDELPF